MVSVSVRQSRPAVVERNSRSSSHPDNFAKAEMPGEGQYDWAGIHQLFAVGSPDPGRPHYEPAHLRHRPGDTFEIGGKPHDPGDNGPFGTPGWRPDRRTGRHRRDELPDPLPPRESEHEPGAASGPAPFPVRRRLRFEETASPTDQPYRFSRLREDAWDRWLIDSEPLAAAHRTTYSASERECGRTIAVLIRLVRWIVAVIKETPVRALPDADSEDPADLRVIPGNPFEPNSPNDSHPILTWEVDFDALPLVARDGAR